MTDDKVNKFTGSTFLKKAVINDFKKPGLSFILNDCIKCRKVVGFDAIDFGKYFGISNF